MIMDQMEQLQSAAMSLLEKAKDAPISDLASALEKAAGVQRLCSDLEKSKAELRRLALEERKLQHENETALVQQRSDRIRDYVSLLTPLISILALAATISLQTWQFTRSEKDRADEALDAQWGEAVKAISQSSKVPPGIIALSPFLNSPKYADRAKAAVVQLLANSTDPTFFSALYGNAFVPIAWDSLDHIISLDRALRTKAEPLWTKTYNQRRDLNDTARLTTEEKDIYDYTELAIPVISTQISSLLKRPRPAGLSVDLSAASLQGCDFSGADLTSVNIARAHFAWADLKGANLDKISQFEGAYFYHVAWWEAAKISPELLAYLEKDDSSSYKPGVKYGLSSASAVLVEPQAYAAALARLKAQTR